MVATVHDHCVQRRLAVLVRRAAKANRAVASALKACHMPKSAAASHRPLPAQVGIMTRPKSTEPQAEDQLE
jgi:hypothetical protein